MLSWTRLSLGVEDQGCPQVSFPKLAEGASLFIGKNAMSEGLLIWASYGTNNFEMLTYQALVH